MHVTAAWTPATPDPGGAILGCRLNLFVLSRPGSATLNAASPAVLVTVAVVVGGVARARAPGTKGAKVAGPPSVSASVAGTVPPTSPSTGAPVLMRSLVVSIQTLPLRPVTRGAVVITAGRTRPRGRRA